MADRESIVRSKLNILCLVKRDLSKQKLHLIFFPVRLDFVRRKKYFAHPQMKTVKYTIETKSERNSKTVSFHSLRKLAIIDDGWYTQLNLSHTHDKKFQRF